MHSFWDSTCPVDPLSWGMMSMFGGARAKCNSWLRLLWLPLSLLAGLAPRVCAQGDSLATPKFTLGLIDGLNVTRLAHGNLDEANYLLRNDRQKVGLEIGFSLNVALSTHVRLRLLPSACFANFNYRIIRKPVTGSFPLEPSSRLESYTLNFPLLVQVQKSRVQRLRPWFQAGLQPTIVLGPKASPFAARSRLACGLVAGVGFDVVIGKVSLSPELRLVQGLTNISDRIPHISGQILPALFAQMLSLQIGFE